MTVPYVQGRRAFEAFMAVASNPYKSGHGSGGMSQQRHEWFNGWYDEWRWQKWGPNEGEKYEPLSPPIQVRKES